MGRADWATIAELMTGSSTCSACWGSSWGLAALSLGTAMLFTQPTVCDQHPLQIISIFAIVSTRSPRIGGLSIARGRRQVAELRSRRGAIEVVHLDRTAATEAPIGPRPA